MSLERGLYFFEIRTCFIFLLRIVCFVFLACRLRYIIPGMYINISVRKRSLARDKTRWMDSGGGLNIYYSGWAHVAIRTHDKHAIFGSLSLPVAPVAYSMWPANKKRLIWAKPDTLIGARAIFKQP